MASLEIGECSNGSSIIQVGYQPTMNDEGEPDLSAARIFRAPKPLRDSNDHFYTPHLVSIGPFHYGRPELSGMEKHKSEAVRRMQQRIQNKNKDANVTIKSIVEVDIMEKYEEIREFYGENIFHISPIKLAWMVTRDACFIFEFIINYIKHYTQSKADYEKRKVSSSTYDPIFELCVQNPTRNRLMDDILLFENQIPLSILQRLLQIQIGSTDAANKEGSTDAANKEGSTDAVAKEGSTDAAAKEESTDAAAKEESTDAAANKELDVIMKDLKLTTTRQNFFMWVMDCPSHERCHVLEAIYYGLVGDLNLYTNSARKLFSPSYKYVPVCLRNVVPWIKANFDTIFSRTCKLYPDWSTMHFPFRKNSDAREKAHIYYKKLPSAGELNSAGVKLHPVLVRNTERMPNEGMPYAGAAIEWIRFDEKTATLYLPEIDVTAQSESLLRNVIAMEVSSESRYFPRPVTQFAKLMDELVDSEEDVAVLTKAGIINNELGSNKEAAEVLNSLTKGMIYSKECKPIDDARRGLHNYTKKKYKILWSEFVSAYCSKPWLVAGSIVATLLLLMTVVQVFCLFYKCSRSPSSGTECNGRAEDL